MPTVALRRRSPLKEAARHNPYVYPGGHRPPSSPHLFLSREGGPLSIRSVQRIVHELGQATGLDVSVTTLRNTCTRSLWKDTGDLALLVERMGHARLETALKYIAPARGNRQDDGDP